MGGCSGDNDIAEMWMRHYKQLYNSVDDGGAKETFYRRVATNVKDSKSCEITVLDVANACSKQKCGKAIGFDGIAMEALIYGVPGFMFIYQYCLISSLSSLMCLSHWLSASRVT